MMQICNHVIEFYSRRYMIEEIKKNRLEIAFLKKELNPNEWHLPMKITHYDMYLLHKDMMINYRRKILRLLK